MVGEERVAKHHVFCTQPGFFLSLICFCFLNLCLPDPFADATKGDDRLPAGTEDYIHIRIQQRNGRKTLTTVQGIATDYDKKKLVKAFKKVLQLFLCISWVVNTPANTQVK